MKTRPRRGGVLLPKRHPCVSQARSCIMRIGFAPSNVRDRTPVPSSLRQSGRPDQSRFEMEGTMKRILHRPMAAALSAILMGTPALAGSPTKTFYNPTYQGLPLDYCVNWSRACGQPAADRYCQGRGLQGAVSFVKRPASPTKLQGTGQICQGPNCASFSAIKCYEYGL